MVPPVDLLAWVPPLVGGAARVVGGSLPARPTVPLSGVPVVEPSILADEEVRSFV